MDKIFFLVDLSVMRQYKWVPLVNQPYCLNFFDEFNFWFDLRHNKGIYTELGDEFTLWSVPSDKRDAFVSACNELAIKIEEIDLHDLYDDYVQQHYVYDPTYQDPIPEENMVPICSQSYQKIICGFGTKQVFLEHKITEKDNIELYINSNEMTGHHTPHCHVKYNDRKNYCVLSLIDYEKIEPDGGVKNAVICKAQELLQKHIQEARKKWNEINALLEFRIVNEEYTSEVQDRSEA